MMEFIFCSLVKYSEIKQEDDLGMRVKAGEVGHATKWSVSRDSFEV
jgi:hypothetical protein